MRPHHPKIHRAPRLHGCGRVSSGSHDRVTRPIAFGMSLSRRMTAEQLAEPHFRRGSGVEFAQVQAGGHEGDVA